MNELCGFVYMYLCTCNQLRNYIPELLSNSNSHTTDPSAIKTTNLCVSSVG